MPRNIKLILEYDATNYHGWQSQQGSGKATVQDALEEALRKLTKEDIRTVSSGRTDAGVHALGHVANFLTESGIPAEAWAPALNSRLPADIRVLASEEADPAFHARFSAKGKQYRYLILARRAPSALQRRRAWHVDRKLNVANMRRAAELLTGRHDFSAFRSAGCGAKSPIRNLKALTIRKKGDFIECTLEADAFLMHMARNIVGTLVEASLTPTTRVDNFTQIVGKTVQISGTLEAVDKAGRKSEKAYQLAKASAEIKRDIENIITANQAKSNGTINTGARKMGALLSYITSNVNKGTAGTNPVGDGSDARGDTTTRTFEESMLKDVAQQIFEDGGTPKLLVVPPGLKATVSAFAGVAQQRYVTGAEPTTIVAAAGAYLSDFGLITRGKILTFKGKPALTYFHANSGGMTEDARHVWSVAIPYLQSVSTDDYSAQAPGAAWSSFLSFDQIRDAMSRNGLKVGQISDLETASQSPSGRAIRLKITHSAGTTVLGGNQFRTITDPAVIKSTLFKAERNSRGIRFEGRGSGHGVGLSQWGARIMAEGEIPLSGNPPSLLSRS